MGGWKGIRAIGNSSFTPTCYLLRLDILVHSCVYVYRVSCMDGVGGKPTKVRRARGGGVKPRKVRRARVIR